MNLLNLSKAIKNHEEPRAGHSVLLYGAPKTGKTRLAATAAESPDIERVFWFDNENGYDTLFTMIEEGLLSEEAAAKIIIIPIKDVRADPYAIETALKTLNSIKTPVYVDLSNGRILHKKPISVDPDKVLEFQMSKLTSKDLVVWDSLSQLGDSALNGTCVGEDYTFKPLLDNYGLMGKWLGDCLTIVQQAAYCNFVCITHESMLEGSDKKTRLYPLCGTSTFTPKTGKYFGTCVYVEKQGVKHKAGSASTYSPQKVTGSRRGIAIENSGEWSIADIFTINKQEKPAPAKTSGLPLRNRLPGK